MSTMPSLRPISLVAWREYKQYVLTRGFWIGLFMFPIFLGFGAAIPQLFDRAAPARNFVLVDQSGLFDAAINRSFERDYQVRVYRAFTAYVRAAADPAALQEGRVPPEFLRSGWSDERVDAFLAAGGWEAAYARVEGALREGAPPFVPPRKKFNRVALPGGIDPASSFDDIAEGLAPYLTGDRLLPSGSELFAAILIPAEIADGDLHAARVQYWGTNISDVELLGEVRGVLNEVLRTREFERRGMDIAVVEEVQDLRAFVTSFDPRKQGAAPEAGGAQVSAADRITQLIPLALAYFLWVGIFTVGNILLTNVVEEKSNKIIEVLLSSVTAHELMIGKLLGILGLGLTTVLFWVGGSVLILLLIPGALASVAAQVAAILLSTPLIPAFLFYFLIGYVMYAAVFLAVGSMCSSMSDAQTYMGPLMIVLFVPLFFLGVIPRDPNGLLATIGSWIPLFTPYIMLMRVASDPPLIDLIGTSILTILTAIFILWMMGRVFRQTILRTGQPPKIKELFGLFSRRN